MLIYLAGKITGLTHSEANKWRNIAKYYLGLHDMVVCNPLDSFDINGDYEPQEIVSHNKFYIHKADIILAEMEHTEPSIGTIGEIVYASMLEKPVFTWGKARYNDNPWMKAHVIRCFETLEDAVGYIVSTYV